MPEYATRVSASFFTSNDPKNPRGWTLRVTDEASSVTILEVSLNAEQFMTAMSGGGFETKTFVTGDFDRLGKKMRHWQVQIPREITGYGRATSAEARVWAEANSPEPYDTLEVRKTNQGDVAIYRKWEES